MTPNENMITAEDIIKFNMRNCKRAQQNLINAEKRGDSKAVTNIKRKIAIYQATISVAEYYQIDGIDIAKRIQESGE